MINEIPQYGEPRQFLGKRSADEIKALNIPTCERGHRLQNGKCNECESKPITENLQWQR